MTRIEKELIKFYLDWANSFATSSIMTEHYNLIDNQDVHTLIDMGKKLHKRNAERIKATRPEYREQYTNLD